MDKKYFNILDFGASKIRFSVFDEQLTEKYSESKLIRNEKIISNQSDIIKLIIKSAEKNISQHIQDIILILDTKNLFCIDVSLDKNLNNKQKTIKVYASQVLELKQIIKTFYPNLEIVHIILDKCIIDDVSYLEIPKNLEEISNIKTDFKLICFPKTILNEIKNNFNQNNINIVNFSCTSYVKASSYIRKMSLEKASFLDIGYEKTSFLAFEKSKLRFIQTVPIGSSHITKDISNIFKITYEEAEKIKKSFNESESEFSYENHSDEIKITVNDILKKKISINLLKKIILYRVQEIIDLSFKRLNVHSYNLKL